MCFQDGELNDIAAKVAGLVSVHMYHSLRASGALVLPPSHDFNAVCTGHLLCHGSYDNKPVSDKWGRKLRIMSNFEDQLLYTAAGSAH